MARKLVVVVSAYVDIVKKLLNFMLPGLGNSVEDNGQDKNEKGEDD